MISATAPVGRMSATSFRYPPDGALVLLEGYTLGCMLYRLILAISMSSGTENPRNVTTIAELASLVVGFQPDFASRLNLHTNTPKKHSP